MTKNEMKAFIETLQAEKQAMVDQIASLQAKPEKAEKTRKTRRTKVTPVQAKPLPGTTAHALQQRRKAARPTIETKGNKTVFSLAMRFDEWCKAQGRASAIKAYLKGEATLGVKAMTFMFEIFSKNGQIASIQDTALSANCHEKSIRGHYNKVADFLATLSK